VGGVLTRKDVSEDAMSARAPEWYRPHVAAVVHCTAKGQYGVPSDVVLSITKQPPLEFHAFVEREQGTFSRLFASPAMSHEAVRSLVEDGDAGAEQNA
jgi:hypothetical protein